VAFFLHKTFVCKELCIFFINDISQAENMDSQVKEIKYDIDKLENMIEILAQDITEIKKALVGNEYGEQGLVKRVHRIEQEVADLKDFKKKLLAWATGAGLGSSTIINAIAQLLN